MKDDDNQKGSDLFRQAMRGVTPLKKTDKVYFKPKHKAKNFNNERKGILSRYTDTSHFFSDEHYPLCDTQDISVYLQTGYPSRLLKQLKRGDYLPEIFLDLHGLTKVQAKEELAHLIDACLNEYVSCASIMHGFGKHILKNQVPQWLAQHPAIIAFHYPPQRYGGKAALWVLIKHLHFEYR